MACCPWKRSSTAVRNQRIEMKASIRRESEQYRCVSFFSPLTGVCPSGSVAVCREQCRDGGCIGQTGNECSSQRPGPVREAVFCAPRPHGSSSGLLTQCGALAIAARCVRHTSPHAIVTGALPMGNLPLSCILFIRSFCSFLPYLPFPHPLPTSSPAAHPDALGLPFLSPLTIPKSPALSCAHAAE